MKRIILTLISCFFIFSLTFAQEYYGSYASEKIPGSTRMWMNPNSSIPAYVEFDAQNLIPLGEFQGWITQTFNLDSRYSFNLVSTWSDDLGYTHYKFEEYYSNYPVDKAFYILHTRKGKIVSMNGLIFDKISTDVNYTMQESDALTHALQTINASVYKWQIPGEEQFLKQESNDRNATYYPKGQLVLINKNIQSRNLRVAYKFNIYAEQPLSRAWYYVDAITGEVIYKDPIIHDVNSTGTAYTKYSGKQTIITDSFSSRFRLRETGRGNGIQTYNMQKGTSYSSAVDFIDSNNIWNQFNANWDEAATDAHWGAEMTYDYYKTKFSRNSLDNAGLLIKSYVHYSTSYSNAFWNGSYMTYGDGTGGKPFTLIDITGHEMTHGVVTFTADLSGSNEGGALNESFADIFGKAVEYFAKPSQASWIMGGAVIPIRNLSNPKTFSDPNTYGGQYWDSVTFEVHKNSNPQSFCFYLLAIGGSGTNDLGHAYNVKGIGRDKAERIFYRALTTYLTSTAGYLESRYATLKAAADLYGDCSPEVTSVYQAWYAIGLGNPKRQASFYSKEYLPNCYKTFTVDFINTSDAFTNYKWYFGDGKTSTAMNPSHTYTNYGNYDVKLVATTSCDTDSVVISKFVILDSNYPCVFIIPKAGGSSTLCHGILLDDGGLRNYSSNTDAKFTITVAGATAILLKFKSFSFEDCGTTDCDYLKIFDGPNTTSTLIGKFTGNIPPNGGVVKSSGNSITLLQHTDTMLNLAGFVLEWQCSNPNMPPVADFTSNKSTSCYGDIKFTDLSVGNPNSWLWDFGDGTTATTQNPTHTYVSNGVYNIRLIARNTHGADTTTKTGFITIEMSPINTTPDTTVCGKGIITLHANGYDNINWYNTGDPAAFPVASGTSYVVPIVTHLKAFWVQGSMNSYIQHAGPVDNTFSSGGYFSANADHYEIFTAYSDMTLMTVKVYANGSGNRTFRLSNSSGQVIKDTIVNVANGMSRVTLNFHIPKDSNLRLGVLGASTPNNLYRNQGGASYPYEIPGVVKIIETDVAPGTKGYYYFLYDWELKIQPCNSIRKRILVTLDSLPAANFSFTTNSFKATFTNTSADGKSYRWDFGDGKSDTSKNPVHTYSGNGDYMVKMVVTNPCGKDSITKKVSIIGTSISGTLENTDMAVYPIPATENIFVKIVSVKPENLRLKFVNTLSQVIMEKTLPDNRETLEKIDVSRLPKGIYFIQLSNDTRTITRKVIVE